MSKKLDGGSIATVSHNYLSDLIGQHRLAMDMHITNHECATSSTPPSKLTITNKKFASLLSDDLSQYRVKIPCGGLKLSWHT